MLQFTYMVSLEVFPILKRSGVADGGEALEPAVIVYHFSPPVFAVGVEYLFVLGVYAAYHFGTVGDGYVSIIHVFQEYGVVGFEDDFDVGHKDGFFEAFAE